MILLQLSAAFGPEECALAVAKAFYRIKQEALKLRLKTQVIEAVPARYSNTFYSILLSIEGEKAKELAKRWAGTIQWICQSPYRPRHRRKNWFIGVFSFTPSENNRDEKEIRFETMRASGPGGQHINKTESAVRAVHIATGISVKISSERSQNANKKLAKLLIAHKLAEMEEKKSSEQVAKRRLLHHNVARGNPTRVFCGQDFTCGSSDKLNE